jgi:hypothetical protein
MSECFIEVEVKSTGFPSDTYINPKIHTRLDLKPVTKAKIWKPVAETAQICCY